MNTCRASICALATLVSALVCGGCERQSAGAAPQQPQTAAAEPCPDADTQAEMTSCWSQQAQEAERAVAEAQRGITVRLTEDRDSDSATRFERAQAQWAAYRDAHCEAVAHLSEGGSIAPLQLAQCRARMARERGAELKLVLDDVAR